MEVPSIPFQSKALPLDVGGWTLASTSDVGLDLDWDCSNPNPNPNPSQYVWEIGLGLGFWDWDVYPNPNPKTQYLSEIGLFPSRNWPQK